MLLAGLGACTSDDDPTDPPASTPASPTAPTAFASPPDGVAPAVAETGFSISPYENDESADLLSYGVLVENPGEFVALDVMVQIRLLDAEGEPIDELSGERTDHPGPQPQAITRLLPGERIGVGRTVPHYGSDVAELDVRVEVGTWSPVQGDQWWFQPISASEVVASDGPRGPTLGFTVDAAYTDDMIRGQLWVGGHFSAIFRDAGGAIVGGADCCHGTGQTQVEVPPGRSQAELYLEYGLPAQADPARTEIYLPDPQENLPG
ncbi:MAG TPA: hypothetical protein VIL37_15455 [Natronosporangium sp.]